MRLIVAAALMAAAITSAAAEQSPTWKELEAWFRFIGATEQTQCIPLTGWCSRALEAEYGDGTVADLITFTRGKEQGNQLITMHHPFKGWSYCYNYTQERGC